MTADTTPQEELRKQVAESLGLEKGGITDHNSPANEHYYYVNEVEDYDTEAIIMTQKINFEDKIQDLTRLIDRKVLEGKIEQATSDLQVVFDIYSGAVSPDFSFELMKERVTRLTAQLNQLEGRES